jgi:ADP-ribose pyrophosphatase YjhB (NUDIX family)
MTVRSFNVRSYGILLNQDSVLLSEEWYPNHDGPILKFPGGGVNLGEGVVDCLIREFREEANLEIKVHDVVHVGRGFVKSHFNDTQVISVYFRVESLGGEPPVDQILMDPEGREGASYRLFWCPLSELDAKKMTFANEKEMVTVLQKYPVPG